MGGKHKRKLREEKSKTKLKGSKLPKGLNITKTDFKVRKIVIREQLKQLDTTEAHSSKNLNVKDCITRLQHHNSSFRTEALNNLKEIITHYPGEVIEKHLGDIVTNLSKLSLDVERNIRRESTKCLDLVLTIASGEHIKPFYEVLSSYTRCAMTHIQVNIQEDSLLLLDILITNIPELISTNRDKIFSSFLNIMSKLKNESKPDRTLTVNLGTKHTSVKWRIQILLRLNRMLEALILQKTKKSIHNTQAVINIGESVIVDAFEVGDDEHTTKTTSTLNYFQENKPMCFPLIYSHSNRICPIPKLFNKSIVGIDDHIDDGTKIKNYASTLMPLLFESWLEVRPDFVKNQSTILSIDGAFTLKNILDIMERLWSLALMWQSESNSNEVTTWFQKTFSKDFNSHIMDAFPYSLGDVRSNAGKKKKDEINERDVQLAGGINCYWQNLTVCFMFCCFNSKIKGNDLKNHERVIDYLSGNFF